MRIGGETLAADFLAEIHKLLFAEPALEKSARINAGRAVALEIDQVAAVRFVRACQKCMKPVS